MANYTTSSGFSDLVGTMVVTDNIVTGYSSNTLGPGTVTPQQQAPPTRFTVRFGPGRAYNINSNANGNGYSGTANNNGPAADQEPWSATASTTGKVDEEMAEPAQAADDAAAKTAAS